MSLQPMPRIFLVIPQSSRRPHSKPKWHTKTRFAVCPLITFTSTPSPLYRTPETLHRVRSLEQAISGMYTRIHQLARSRFYAPPANEEMSGDLHVFSHVKFWVLISYSAMCDPANKFLNCSFNALHGRPPSCNDAAQRRFIYEGRLNAPLPPRFIVGYGNWGTTPAWWHLSAGAGTSLAPIQVSLLYHLSGMKLRTIRISPKATAKL